MKVGHMPGSGRAFKLRSVDVSESTPYFGDVYSEKLFDFIGVTSTFQRLLNMVSNRDGEGSACPG